MENDITETPSRSLSALQFGHGGDAVENGVIVSTESGRAAARLQFGHGGDAVENALLPADSVWCVARLQFGHGGDAVENFRDQDCRPQWTHCRFNSATAVMPWKIRMSGCILNAVLRFNSATAVMPWKTSILSCSGLNLVNSFNSATAVMPWKTAIGRRLSSPFTVDRLQFGHGGDAVEKPSGRHCGSIRPRR